MPRRFVIAALATLIIFAGSSIRSFAMEVSKPIPSNLAAQDANGKTRSFQDLTGKNGVVLVFFRSADW
ncbi:MAG: hypothetical protein CMM48_08310 [Rhodospirillaceae bacterium]|nr:hypothetical protein [Rhodospirillaceae bacterium]HAA92787.1 hypothetical protein [Rhodospirillaceae bacterium]|tara:strand:- start:323 stop:526 length:204 start_codon:yes stop_codon:yes gene_type:complete